MASAGYTQRSAQFIDNFTRGPNADSVRGIGGERSAGDESPGKTDTRAPARPHTSGRGKRGRGGGTPSSKLDPALNVRNYRSHKPSEITNIPEILERYDEPMCESHNNTESERFPSTPNPLKKDMSVEGPDPSLAILK